MTVRRALDEAQAHIREIDKLGELPLPVRRQLRGSLVRLLPRDKDALAFVAGLGLACAKRAWPAWETAFPSESRPMDLAQKAISSIMEENASDSCGTADLVKVKAYLDNKLLLGREYFAAIYAGFSSWAVARDVLSQDPAMSIIGNTELEISPEEWDPCFLASLAVTGGATWEGTGATDARREFWHWYLTVAVPQAFAAAVER